jgi:hypothetical protein
MERIHPHRKETYMRVVDWDLPCINNEWVLVARMQWQWNKKNDESS